MYGKADGEARSHQYHLWEEMIAFQKLTLWTWLFWKISALSSLREHAAQVLQYEGLASSSWTATYTLSSFIFTPHYSRSSRV